MARNMDVVPQRRRSGAERRAALVDGLWALALPVLIIGGLRGGIFTPTEAAVVAAVYSLFVSLFIYRQVKVSELMPLFVNAARTTSVVMFLVAAAMVSSYMITLADLPDQVIELLTPILDNRILLMLGIVVLLLAAGIVLDLTPTILILGPVLAPLAAKAGIDPVYFGVIFIMTGCIGLLTPPICTVLNVVCGVAKISMESATKGVWPFLLTYSVLLLLLVVMPEIVTVPAKFFH
jgi:tripartite ATP-independent transporter DctM subunit